MEARDLRQYRSVGIIWFVLGLVLWLVLDSAAGIVFFILGAAYLARTSKTGESLADEKPRLVWVVLIGLTILVALVAFILLVVK